jgi:molybdopterin molybdotransferase
MVGIIERESRFGFRLVEKPVVKFAQVGEHCTTPMTDPDVSHLISVQQATAIIDGAAVRPCALRMELADSYGLFLAEDLKNDRDAPPFDKSLMDGYAVRAQDVRSIPCELTVTETVAAGEAARSALEAGQAMAIMTGAPLPDGADAVVPIEATEILRGTNRVLIREAGISGRYIARRGCDAAAGAVVLKTGMKIGPAQIAVAASIGAVKVPVFAPPSIGVLGTGDELVAPDQIPTGSQIRSCNNAMLMALLGGLPCRAVDLGIVHDDPAAIEGKIKSGLSHDILLVTGGMSMGERDFVPGILRRLGGDLKITKLKIKPGKPFVFAELRGGKFVFGLAGNPVSAFVCTVCLVSRLIRRMAGGSADGRVGIAPISRPLEANGPRAFYQPAIFDGKSLLPLKWIGSADVYTLAQANALLIRPENQPALDVGATAEFIEI